MRSSLIVPTLTLIAAAIAAPAAAQTAEVSVFKAPGMVSAARTVTINATITAIDAKTREVTLKGPQGREVKIIAEPDVKNFAQLKVGDNVEVKYLEALAAELKKGGGLPVARSETGGMQTAQPGATPGAIVGRRVRVVGDVVGVDDKTQTVTVRGPNRTVELTIADPDQFKLIAKGDQLEADFVEGAAVSIVPKK